MFPILAMFAGAAQAQVVLVENQLRYRLDGASIAAVRRQMSEHLTRGDTQQRPRAHGLTESGLEARYDLTAIEPIGCAVSDLRVTLSVTTTLPEWRPRVSPPHEVREGVERMIAGLVAHEAGHRRNAIAAAVAMDEKLRAIPDAPNCRRARQLMDRIVKRETVRLYAREMRYDRATDHGRTQGARLDVTRPSDARRAGSPSW